MRYIAKKLGLPTHYVWASLLGAAFGLAFIFLLCKWLGVFFAVHASFFN
jgi:hypothetical protein